MNSAPAAAGLDGVIVAETRLSGVDGARGTLVLRGHPIGELAATLSFGQLCRLLWEDTEDGADPYMERLGAARAAAFAHLPDLARPLVGGDFMAALQAVFAQMGPPDDDAIQASLNACGAMAVVVPALARAARGEAPVAPDVARGHAEDVLHMLHNVDPSAAQAAALETYLVTVADHGMNASTFTARVVASTASDLVSALVAALAALKGPLHGGAPGPVLDMLDAIGSADHAAAWLQAELDAGRRIMGMGHRVYRVRDPRVDVLETALAQLEAAGHTPRRLELAHAVEREAVRLLAIRHPDRPIQANVEFATATLLEAVGVPRELFTGIFAVARSAGWCAHVMEQRANGRLLRPRARYVG